MTRFVLHTSALLRLYLPDGPIPPGLEDAVEAAGRGDALLIAPELLLVEMVAVLLKKEKAGLLSAEESQEIRSAILDLPIQFRSHAPLVADALEAARTEGVTAYDAMYLVLSRREHAPLLTADARLARRVAG